MKLLINLFLVFAKIGVMTFGGGYAMLPILDREIVSKRGWATNEELTDYYAVGQCTPGIIAVNTATFVGFNLAGNAGGIAATFGVVFPSLIIICIIAGLLTNFGNYTVVQHALAGIRVCVCVLIFNAVVKLWKSAVKDKPAFVIFILVFVLSVFWDISPVFFVIISAAAGIVIKTLEVKNSL